LNAKIPLATFIVLTLVFAALAFYESTNQAPISTITVVSLSTVTTTVSLFNPSLSASVGTTSGTETTSTTNASGTLITVSGVSLCPSNCIYPAPYATALVNFTGSSPVSTLKVYVNNTYESTPLQNPNNMTHYAYLWKGSVPNSMIPVVKGDTYVFEFTVVYQDGSMGSAYAEVVAD
jgi:hypothetical protein